MKKNHQGFTLIEMLVVIGILLIVGTMVVGLFFQTLKGASKVEILKEVKQNGDYALGVMERMIRNARATPNLCNNTDEAFIIITNPDNGTTTFSLAGGQIASNSGRLTGTNVSATALTFHCNPLSPPVVNITFTMAQTGSPIRPEERAQVSFKTTVSLRTYK